MDDKHYIKLALEMAGYTCGQTTINPSVGAVVVKNNSIIGLGVHVAAGSCHAEIHALNMAGNNACGATLYVTLEPCCHHGKTAPCVDAIIKAKIKRVVVAIIDPNPLVAGQGILKLQNHGIEVVVGVMEKEARALNEVFFHYIQNNMPYVTLKTAMSLDGKVATVWGDSKWITNEKSREDAHRYRHSHDAILVGIETVLADNPELTTRLKDGGKNPIRIVLDSKLRTPLTSKLVSDGMSQTWIIVGSAIELSQMNPYIQIGVKIIQMDEVDIKIKPLLIRLAKEGISSVLVEGGSKVHTSFIEAKLFNQLILYMSSMIIGGSYAPNFFVGLGCFYLKDALHLDIKKVEKLDDNLKIIVTPKKAL